MLTDLFCATQETTVPLDYRVARDDVCVSLGDIRDLVESLSYLYQMRTAAMSQLAPDLYGVPPEDAIMRVEMRQKRDIDPEKVCLGRECIDNGVELAEYALALLNFERDVKHAFVRLLGWSGVRHKSGLVKQGVHMEAREINGDDASIVSIAANLHYCGGEYVYIEHSVLVPGDIPYSCAKYVPISQSLLDRKRHPDRERGAVATVYARKKKMGNEGTKGDVVGVVY